MMFKNIKTHKLTSFIAVICFTLILGAAAFGQTTVFSDDFSTNTSATYTTSGAINTSSFSVTRSGVDWGARRNTSPEQLELTNDTSATTNLNGWVYASTATGSFTAPYNTTLNANAGLITWTFNMRQIRTDPAGFGLGSYGVAFVLGSTSTDVATMGDGYAVVLGQSGATDPIRLARFTGGLQGTLTNIITSNTAGLTDFGANYLSIKVTYAPTTDTWELSLRDDGSTAFADPTTGTLVSQGTVVDSTFTGVALTSLGGYWQGSTTANQTAFFDNVTVTEIPVLAGEVLVAGRVLDNRGFPISNATVTISGGPLTQPRTFTTSGFGYFQFRNVSVGNTYVISVMSGRYSFDQPAQVISVNDEQTDLLFVGTRFFNSGKK